MFIPIPNRRGGTRVPNTLAFGIVRGKSDGLRLDVYIHSLFVEAVKALGLDNGNSAVEIAVGVAQTPDEGLMSISRGDGFRVQKPCKGKPYYRFGFYLTRLVPRSLAEELYSKFSRVWIPKDKIRVQDGQLIVVLPDPLRKVLSRTMLDIAKKGGCYDEREQNS